MVDAADIRDALINAGVPPGVIGLFDDEYELPSPDWITGELGTAFRKFLFDSGIVYRHNQFDCDKYSLAAVLQSVICWFKTQQSESALAFGLFAFATQGHCICVAVHTAVPGSGAVENLRVSFYEPQPSPYALQEVKLTAEDIQSCVGCLFL